jgi:hypothetical protein
MISRWNIFRVSAALLALSTLPAFGEATIKSKIVDAETQSLTETISDTKGRIIKKTRFFFDEHNWSKGAIHFTTKDEVKYKEVFKRDSSGRLLEAHLFDKDDRKLGKRIYHYDGAGKLLRIDDYDARGQALVPARRAEPVRKPR